ncbi:MAG: ribosome assembly factor SBDS [archaeon]
MVPLNKTVLARYIKGDLCFEILVDPNAAYEFREKKNLPLDQVVASFDIYSSVREGTKATAADLSKVFGTTDPQKIISRIIIEGEIQITTEQKRKMIEEKRKQIISIISRNAIDAQTKTPIPPMRIETALEQIKVKIDPFKPADVQAKEILTSLKKILPIKMASFKIAVKIPAQYASKAYSFIKSQRPIKEEWGKDGSFFALVEIPAGMQADFYDNLNSLTSGENECKIVETVDY